MEKKRVKSSVTLMIEWFWGLDQKQRNIVLNNLFEDAIDSEQISFRDVKTAKDIAEESGGSFSEFFGVYYTSNGKLLSEEQ